MDTTATMPFYQEAKRFLKRQINHRRHLIRINANRKNLIAVSAHLDYLEKHLNYFKFNSNPSMASFMLNNQDKIRNIIPARNEATFQQLDRYITTALLIQKQKPCESQKSFVG